MSVDLISRQAVIDGLASIAKAKSKSDAQKSLIGRVVFFTEHLPSVNPQESKTGHWILGVCDECGYDWGKDAPIASVPNFCPNCGARMVEPQESEEV